MTRKQQRRLQQGKTHEGLHALLWPVSRLLVRYVEAHKEQFDGAHVLELGAGVVRGMRSLYVLCFCASRRVHHTARAPEMTLRACVRGWRALAPRRTALTCSSQTRHARLTRTHAGAQAPLSRARTSSRLARCRAQLTGLTAANVASAAATGVAGSVACDSLDWTEAVSWLAARASAGKRTRFDLILGADIVYHQQFDFTPVKALAALLAALLTQKDAADAADDADAESSQPPPRILFGYQERDCAARLAFWEALAAHGLRVVELSLEALGASGVDTAGLSGPMVLWWIEKGQLEAAAVAVEAAPAEAEAC
jgi:hypothetical protein